ncbi:MAG: glycosyltransferase [Bacteroidetes bacterium]|jgi:glycosyltransferase involved in cell wall biosynthesis|nr:glycosyltransferase [Bacteroidota bacterium]MBK6837655.1 glycosyltransferase [Bacteroidota bacterium]MBK9525480.1 glycosyltransferase [Bacteroidota bacterium]MBP6402853.1 glycosyltransferase [Bacteroidia bacterium]MBP6648697.1 glycosyltransferase [Bacteroidia bacterium]
MKRILLLSDINSAHTQKWAGAVAKAGFETGIFSLSAPVSDWYTQLGIQLLASDGFEKKHFYSPDILKAIYFFFAGKVKKVIQDFNPDFVHAHYLSSYGTLGRLSRFHPLIVSAWGSDLQDFPQRSFLHRNLIRRNLECADIRIASSSILAKEIEQNFHLSAQIIPFGIDTNRFRPLPEERKRFKEEIVIGTIKSLEPVYAPEILLRAFAKLVKENTSHSLRLFLVGDGSLEPMLRRLVLELNISEQVTFEGKVNYSEVHRFHNQMDIFVNISLRESFGVAVLEASACGKPVVLSTAEGLREVFVQDQTGLAVGIGSIDETAAALSMLIKDRILREKMGEEGRKFVIENFDWERNVGRLISLYETKDKQ